MYKIKEVADLFGITTQRIRYYEKEGLMMPDYRDKTTGYRYYSEDSIGRLSEIIQLRCLGMSIRQLKSYFGNEFNKEEKINELKHIVEICNMQIRNLEILIQWENNKRLDVPKIKQIPETYVIQKQINVGQSAEVLKYFGEMMQLVNKYQLRLHMPIIFLIQPITTLKENDATIILSLAVDTPDQENTVYMPSYKAATLLYVGLHSELSKGYEKLYEFAKEQKLEIIGPINEYFMIPYNPVYDTCLVELRMPIA